MAEFIVDTTDGIMNATTTGKLVRCRECVFMETRKHFGGIAVTCYLDPDGNLFDGPDGYCSKAERREAAQWS